MTKKTERAPRRPSAGRRGESPVPGRSTGSPRADTAPATNEELRAERRARALEEPLDVRPVQTVPYLALEVRNPVRQSHYQVLVPGFPSREGAICSCPDFARRGIGTCKHLEAVWLYLDRESPPAPRRRAEARPSAELWTEIDRRLNRLEPAKLSGRSLRAVGAVLIEPGGKPEASVEREERVRSGRSSPD